MALGRPVVDSLERFQSGHEQKSQLELNVLKLTSIISYSNSYSNPFKNVIDARKFSILNRSIPKILKMYLT